MVKNLTCNYDYKLGNPLETQESAHTAAPSGNLESKAPRGQRLQKPRRSCPEDRKAQSLGAPPGVVGGAFGGELRGRVDCSLAISGFRWVAALAGSSFFTSEEPARWCHQVHNLHQSAPASHAAAAASPPLRLLARGPTDAHLLGGPRGATGHAHVTAQARPALPRETGTRV